MSDMRNPKNWKSSTTQNQILQNLDESGYVTCHVTLIGSWQSKHPKLHQAELPQCIQCTGVRQTNNGCVQAYFSSPPRPSPLFWRVSLSLGIIFWLAPTLGQFARPNRSHCRVRLLCSDLRSGLRSGPIWAVRFFSVPCPPECYLQSETKIEHDLRTINELEKWCFEIIRT